jgi:hypothetical protein
MSVYAPLISERGLTSGQLLYSLYIHGQNSVQPHLLAAISLPYMASKSVTHPPSNFRTTTVSIHTAVNFIQLQFFVV